MNLEKLFQTQKVLRDRIGYNEPDRFNKLILALLVELGECANEWRGFKFWSVNQLPHTSAVRVPCMMEEDKEYYNPLLEEYVDCLHFVLELGLEKRFDTVEFPYLHEHNFDIYTNTDTVIQFNRTFNSINEFEQNDDLESYEEVFLYFIGLSRHFNFTWEQIEQAYFEKNKINHHRQEVGY
jgi:dimeric dUTPase (all-alpha-NTP-PPase superfamily)